MPSPQRTRAIRRALACYLRTHRHACDTADGIARWWVPQDLNVLESELLPILACYEARGLVRMFASADGRCYYRRRQAQPQGLPASLSSPSSSATPRPPAGELP
jgi:hypothetical protein